MLPDREFRAKAKTRSMLAALGVAVVAACNQPLETRVAAADIQEMEASNVIFGMTSYLTASGVREGTVQLTHAVGTNMALIGVLPGPDPLEAEVTVAIDNLVKGAGGQALQAMNLALGFPETAGLDSALPFPI